MNSQDLFHVLQQTTIKWDHLKTITCKNYNNWGTSKKFDSSIHGNIVLWNSIPLRINIAEQSSQKKFLNTTKLSNDHTISTMEKQYRKLTYMSFKSSLVSPLIIPIYQEEKYNYDIKLAI